MTLRKREKMDSLKTSAKLLAAAGAIFAEKGFRDATIAAICNKAGANIAAVNYYFGSKENLYREAWRHAFEKSIQAHPPDGGVKADSAPEDRLRGQIAALIHRVADKTNRDFWFVHREIADPTGLLGKAIQDALRPMHQKTADVIRELLGPQVTESQARFCETSIISQCVNPMVIPHKLSVTGKKRDRLWNIDEIDAYAEHVTTFSLAGIRAIREAAQRRNSTHDG